MEGQVRILGVDPERGDTRQHAVADTGHGSAVALALRHEDARHGAVLVVPCTGSCHELTVLVAACDLEHSDRGEGAWARQLAPGAGDEAFLGHVP